MDGQLFLEKCLILRRFYSKGRSEIFFEYLLHPVIIFILQNPPSRKGENFANGCEMKGNMEHFSHNAEHL